MRYQEHFCAVEYNITYISPPFLEHYKGGLKVLARITK